MNYSEEQDLEVEALQAIFVHENELEMVNEAYPDREFKLNLVPFPDGDEENYVQVQLHVKYPAEYPEVAPEIKLISEDGVSPTGDGGALVALKSEKVQELRSLVDEQIEMNLGMPSLYMIAECAQEFLRTHNQKPLTMHEEMLLREEEEAGPADGGEGGSDDEYDDDDLPDNSGEAEWKGLDQKELCKVEERVTPDQFHAWRAKFNAEMEKKGLWKLVEKLSDLTGKEWFSKNVKDDAQMAKEEQAAEDAEMEIDEEVFGDEEDVDLDAIEEDE